MLLADGLRVLEYRKAMVTLEDILVQLTTVSTKLDGMKLDVNDIKGHISVLNDGSHATSIQLATLNARIEIWEKLIWLVVGAAVIALVGAIFSLILHRRNSHHNGQN